MSVTVDATLCAGFRKCVSAAPEIFVVDQQRNVAEVVQAPDETNRAFVQAAAVRCPTGAIEIVEDR